MLYADETMHPGYDDHAHESFFRAWNRLASAVNKTPKPCPDCGTPGDGSNRQCAGCDPFSDEE